jgi:hypothetical protein
VTDDPSTNEWDACGQPLGTWCAFYVARLVLDILLSVSRGTTYNRMGSHYDLVFIELISSSLGVYVESERGLR